MKRLSLWILGLVSLVATLWLGWSLRAGNSMPIELDLVWIRFPNVELWRVLLVALGIGAAVSTLLVGFAWMRSRLLNRRYRKTIQRLEAELHELRSLPLMGSDPTLTRSAMERG